MSFTLLCVVGGLLIWTQGVSVAAQIPGNGTGAQPCREGEFRCKNGACVSEPSRCNNDQLQTPCASTLPPQPDHGAYVRFVDPETVPDDSKDFLVLNYTCKEPYKLIGRKFVICSNGNWVHEFPTCQAVCRLPRSLRTFYQCPVSGKSSIEGYKECDWMVPMGMRVQPMCRPHFYSQEELEPMVCENGQWNYIPNCISECGRVIPKATLLIAGGGPATRGEFPWHVGIYSKMKTPYEQICGGSIISKKVVISAAHCFWEAGILKPPCQFAVAAGKLYRSWTNKQEDYVQRRDVIDMIVPPRFRGVQTSFQDDIALVVLSKALAFVVVVKPVCIDFENEFDYRQLQPGNMGKVAGWGYTSEEGDPSPLLKVAELPNVSITQCYNDTPFQFTPYITADKICAGYKDGTATVCKGDSGGGLVFPELSNDVTRYYLRGIVSTAPSDGLKCNTETITAFTHVISHRDFIKSYFVNFNETGFQFFDARKVTVHNQTDCL